MDDWDSLARTAQSIGHEDDDESDDFGPVDKPSESENRTASNKKSAASDSEVLIDENNNKGKVRWKRQ